MIVNGKEQTLTESVTVSAFLETAGYNSKRVVVERNRIIIRKANSNQLGYWTATRWKLFTS